MFYQTELEMWLRQIESSDANREYMKLEASETESRASKACLYAHFQQVSASLAAAERALSALRGVQVPWWRFWAKARCEEARVQADEEVRKLRNSRQDIHSKLNEAEKSVTNLKERKRQFLDVPAVWRARRGNFGAFVKDEYAKLMRVSGVSAIYVEKGALVVETAPWICKGIDTDGSRIIRELGKLRVSFRPWKEPELRNLTRTVEARGDIWDAPHHPRHLGECWTPGVPYDVWVAEGKIALAVEKALSSLRAAAPETEHETWGVPILKLFPEADVEISEVRW